MLVLVPNEDGNPAIDIVTVHNGLDFDPKKQAGPKGVKVEPGDKGEGSSTRIYTRERFNRSMLVNGEVLV